MSFFFLFFSMVLGCMNAWLVASSHAWLRGLICQYLLETHPHLQTQELYSLGLSQPYAVSPGLRTCLSKWCLLGVFCCYVGWWGNRVEMTAYLARAVRMPAFLVRLREELQAVSPSASPCKHSMFGPVSQGLFSFSQFCLLTEAEFQGPAFNYTGLLFGEKFRNDSIASTYILTDFFKTACT